MQAPDLYQELKEKSFSLINRYNPQTRYISEAADIRFSPCEDIFRVKISGQDYTYEWNTKDENPLNVTIGSFRVQCGKTVMDGALFEKGQHSVLAYHQCVLKSPFCDLQLNFSDIYPNEFSGKISYKEYGKKGKWLPSVLEISGVAKDGVPVGKWQKTVRDGKGFVVSREQISYNKAGQLDGLYSIQSRDIEHSVLYRNGVLMPETQTKRTIENIAEHPENGPYQNRAIWGGGLLTTFMVGLATIYSSDEVYEPSQKPHETDVPSVLSVSKHPSEGASEQSDVPAVAPIIKVLPAFMRPDRFRTEITPKQR